MCNVLNTGIFNTQADEAVVDGILKSIDRLRSDALIPETGSTERMHYSMLASYKVI